MLKQDLCNKNSALQKEANKEIKKINILNYGLFYVEKAFLNKAKSLFLKGVSINENNLKEANEAYEKLTAPVEDIYDDIGYNASSLDEKDVISLFLLKRHLDLKQNSVKKEMKANQRKMELV